MKYSLLIIEDEPIEQEAIRLMLGDISRIGLVETAENGYEALKLCEKFSPDIAVVDINMPGISGLETISRIQETHSKTMFLILSSYNSFDYARQAIQLGVEDFIVKPAKVAHLQQAVLSVVEKLDNAEQSKRQTTMLANRMDSIRPILESDCIYTLISNGRRDTLNQIFSFLEFEIQSGFCFVVGCAKGHRAALPKIKRSLNEVGMRCIGEQLHNKLVFFVLNQHPIEQRRTGEIGNFVAMILSEMQLEASVGVGEIFDDPHMLNKSYNQAMRSLAICERRKSRFVVYDTVKDDASDNKPQGFPLNKLVAAMENSSLEDFSGLVNQAADAIVYSTSVFAQSRESIYRALLALAKQAELLYPMLNTSFSQLDISMAGILEIQGDRQLKLYFENKCMQIKELIQNETSINTQTLVGKAISIIEQEYSKNLSLDDIAGKLQITPFYLSKLLKKDTGKNFTDLVAEKRISVAKILLEGNLSMKEIAYEVGFNSQNYFTKIFKKYVGVTPSEYKINPYIN